MPTEALGMRARCWTGLSRAFVGTVCKQRSICACSAPSPTGRGRGLPRPAANPGATVGCLPRLGAAGSWALKFLPARAVPQGVNVLGGCCRLKRTQVRAEASLVTYKHGEVDRFPPCAGSPWSLDRPCLSSGLLGDSDGLGIVPAGRARGARAGGAQGGFDPDEHLVRGSGGRTSRQGPHTPGPCACMRMRFRHLLDHSPCSRSRSIGDRPALRGWFSSRDR